MKTYVLFSLMGAGAMLFALWPRRAQAVTNDGYTVDVLLGNDIVDEPLNTDALPDKRGFRNNNPGNIEWNEHNDWKGQTGSDGRYSIFSEMRYGIRAMGITIRNYQRLYGINTVRGIVSRYAPPKKKGRFENDTASYIKSVSQRTGLHPDEPVDLNDTKELETLLHAMIYHENGHELSFSQIADGLGLM